jgi:hypothetical protein
VSLTKSIQICVVLSVGVACGGDDGVSHSGTTSSSTSVAGETSLGGSASDGPTGATGAVDESGSSDSGSGGVACVGGDGRPSARGEIDAVWDAPRQRKVFFGGDQGTPVM